MLWGLIFIPAKSSVIALAVLPASINIFVSPQPINMQLPLEPDESEQVYISGFSDVIFFTPCVFF